MLQKIGAFVRDLNSSIYYQELKRHKALLSAAIFVLLGQAILVALTPLPLRFIIDKLLGQKSFDSMVLVELPGLGISYYMTALYALYSASLILLLLAGFQFVLDLTEEVSVSNLGIRLVSGIRAHLAESLSKQTQAFLIKQKKMDLIGRLSADAANLEILVTAGLSVAFRAIPTLGFILIMMFWVEPKFSMILLVSIPFIISLIVLFTEQLKQNQRVYRRETTCFEDMAAQMISKLSVLKSFNSEKIAAKKLARQSEVLKNSLQAFRRSFGMLHASLNGSRNFLRVSVILLGAWSIFHKMMSLGDLVLFIAYIESLNKPINEISKFVQKSTKAWVSIRRVEELNESFNKNKESSGQKRLEQTIQALEIVNMSFAYPRQKPLFYNLNLSFKKREAIVMLGASGSGKSSFVSLMNRLRDPISGQIKLNGQPLQDFDLEELRSKITLVPQAPLLFSASIKMNLSMGRELSPICTPLLWKSLERAQLADFVAQLPEKLDTPIGEGGLTLSGGQAKRLSLARAFFRRSSIYVFDEPTSGLDPETADLVMNELLQFLHILGSLQLVFKEVFLIMPLRWHIIQLRT